MSASREIELKFEVRPDDLAALRGHALLEKVPCDEKRQTSIYFDTADGKFRDVGVTLRVRESEGHYIQTVKATGVTTGGLFDRGEWETQLEANEPDLDIVKTIPLGSKLRKKLSDAAILPVFETVVDRSAWQVSDGTDEIELVLDRGEVVAPIASALIMEIELELKGGSTARLFDLARQLNASVPLRIGVLTKSERGYRLLGGHRRSIVKAEPIALASDQAAGPGFQAIAFACIRHFRLNEPLFVGDRKGEALHQMRVALRRLRSAMSLFAPLISGDETEAIKTELRWISGLLGSARDLDVFVQKRLDPAKTSPELWTQVLGQREAAFDEAIAALETERFRALMISLIQWIATGQWLDADGEAGAWRAQLLGDFAPTRLDRLWHKLKKRGRHLVALEDEERHRVRIAAKKIRYASEFFAALYAEKKSHKQRRAFVAALAEFQEQLGSLNDLVNAGPIAEKIASHINSPEAREELLTGVRADTESEKLYLLAAGEVAYTALVDEGPYWH